MVNHTEGVDTNFTSGYDRIDWVQITKWLGRLRLVNHGRADAVGGP